MSFFKKIQQQLLSKGKIFHHRQTVTEDADSSAFDADFNFDTIPVCPACTSNNVAVFVYGKPQLSRKFVDGFESGKIISGGCMIHKTAPKWHCHSCNKDFGRLL